MNKATIKRRFFIIKDTEIISRLVEENVQYVHFFLVNDTGGASLMAKPPEDNELTLGKNYKRVSINADKASFSVPKHLLSHIGSKVWYYVERLNPEPGELFRIKPADFSLSPQGSNLKDQLNPYFAKNYLVIPHHYLNKYINHTIVKLQVSFDRTVPEALSHNYIFAFLSDMRFLGRKQFYFLEKRRTNLRTKKLTKFIEFLKANNKNIHNYQYLQTLPLRSCLYGLIVFKEVTENG